MTRTIQEKGNNVKLIRFLSLKYVNCNTLRLYSWFLCENSVEYQNKQQNYVGNTVRNICSFYNNLISPNSSNRKYIMRFLHYQILFWCLSKRHKLDITAWLVKEKHTIMSFMATKVCHEAIPPPVYIPGLAPPSGPHLPNDLYARDGVPFAAADLAT